MSLHAFRNRRPAFTLIEVLVVVAIIALLVSILLPSLKQAREQAKVTVCVANLSTIGKAVSAYLSAEQGEVPVHLRHPRPLHSAALVFLVLWRQCFGDLLSRVDR